MRTIPKKNRDLQRARPAGECALCGGELYGGCPCWRLGGAYYCGQCLGTLLAPYRVRLGGEAAV